MLLHIISKDSENHLGLGATSSFCLNSNIEGIRRNINDDEWTNIQGESLNLQYISIPEVKKIIFSTIFSYSDELKVPANF